MCSAIDSGVFGERVCESVSTVSCTTIESDTVDTEPDAPRSNEKNKKKESRNRSRRKMRMEHGLRKFVVYDYFLLPSLRLSK